MTGGRRHRRWWKLATLAASTLIALFAVEALTRLFVYGTAALSYSQMASVRHLGTSGLIRASDHPGVLYELRPGVRDRHKLVTIETNAHGLRDRDYAPEKPPGVFRVAVLGDSLTMGAGVAIEDVYHSVLERRLDGRSGGPAVEFINFGVGGYGLSQYVATLRHRALDWDPDLILVGFYAGNDARRPSLEDFERPYEVKSTTNGFWASHSLDLLRRIWFTWSKRMGWRRSGGDPGETAGNPQRQWIDEQFGLLADLARPRGIPVVVAYLDTRVRNPRALDGPARRHGLVLVDTTAAFEGADPYDHAIYLTDPHPNAEGNRIFADTLQPVIERLISAAESR